MAQAVKKRTQVRRLTDTYVRTRKLAAKGERDFTRSAVHNRVLLCVTDKLGPDKKPYKSFLYGTVRFPGDKHPTRRELGTYPAMSIADAHKKAREWDVLIGRGVDPRQEERQRAEEARRAKLATIDNVFAQCVSEFVIFCEKDGQKRWRETRRILDKEFVSWADKPIDSIIDDDAIEVIEEIAKRSKYTAFNALTAANSLFTWAEERKRIPRGKSPTAGIRPKWLIGKRKPRTHTLDDAHVRAFWNAAIKLGYPYGDLYRLLLLTGPRREEWVGAKYSELSDGWMAVPSERFKKDHIHLIPLSTMAQSIVDSLPQFQGDDYYLFSFSSGHSPVNSHSEHKCKLDALMRKELGRTPFKLWKLHDLRRTVRTGMAKLKVDTALAKMTIGHGHGDVLERTYNQYEYADEIRDALELWAGSVRDLVTPPPDNVRRLAG